VVGALVSGVGVGGGRRGGRGGGGVFPGHKYMLSHFEMILFCIN